jgi:hypothetical protein
VSTVNEATEVYCRVFHSVVVCKLLLYKRFDLLDIIGPLYELSIYGMRSIEYDFKRDSV